MIFHLLFLFQRQITITFKNLLQRVERAVLKCFHRPFGPSKHSGDLLVGHIGKEL
jgi:hypothetical protein